MAKRFVARLFRSSSLPADVHEALADLSRLAEARKELTGPIALLSDILPLLYKEPGEESLPQITPEHASAKLLGGIPLLRGERVSFDLKSLARRWLKICAAMERREKNGAAKSIAEAVRRGRLDPGELSRELLAGRAEGIYARASNLDLDPGTVTSVLRLSLFPVMTRLGNELTALRHGTRWEQGYCPACGSWPLLGEFRGLEQLRFLRCGLCAADWEFPRLRCPFCGAHDHNVLGYIHVEGEETKYRAATCDACRGYVKMFSTLGPSSPPQLLVIELATMHLDLIAAERGYTSAP